MLYNGTTTIPGLQEHLLKNIPGLKSLSKTSLKYLFTPPHKSRRVSGRYLSVIDARPAPKNNSKRKPNPSAHFCAAQVKFMRDFCAAHRDICDLFSADDKSKININGKTAVSRYHQLRHFFLSGQAPIYWDHDFPTAGYLLIPSGYFHISFVDELDPKTNTVRTKKKGKLHVILRSARFASSTAESHLNDLVQLLQRSSKPITCIISDNGPDLSLNSKKTLLALGRLWRDSKKDALMLAIRLLAGVILSHILPGEKFPPSQQSNLTEEELAAKEKKLFDAGMEIVKRHWDKKRYGDVPISCEFIPCGEEPSPYNDAELVKEVLKLAGSVFNRPETSKTKLSEKTKATIHEFKFVVQHIDRRSHFLMFAKCSRASCTHCTENPISMESREALFDLMEKHGGRFYSPTENPDRPGHFLNY
ncbi:unnamed protein product, partial [Heterosigma akashiwo]